MKICAISDLHGNLLRAEYIPVCDVLIIAGDICPAFNHDPIFQGDWLQTDFYTWLETLSVEKIILTFGNHDFVAEQYPEKVRCLPATVLIDEPYEYKGFKFYGSPWSVEFLDWAFGLNEENAAEKYSQIPDDTHILISHGPPFEYGDRTVDDNNIGSKELLKKIQQIRPEYVICGHCHEGYGSYFLNRTKIYNVSLLNEQYRMVNEPVVFEI